MPTLAHDLSQEFQEQITAIKNKVQRSGTLSEIAQQFYNYTLHDMQHFEHVAQNLAELIKPLHLDDRHRFCLVAASYCHDLGMACNEPNAIGIWKSRNEVRRWHARFSRSEVEQMNAEIDDPGLRQAIGIVCEGHGRWDLDHSDFDPIYGIDVRLLAALLSLADVLDLRFERRNPKDVIGNDPDKLTTYPFLNEALPYPDAHTVAAHPALRYLSHLHWLRHYYATQPSLIASENNRRVRIRLEARIGVERDEQGNVVYGEDGNPKLDFRRPVIEEIIQKDVLDLLQHSPFKDIITAAHLTIGLEGPFGPWSTYVYSRENQSKMLFPPALVKTAFVADQIRPNCVFPLKDADQYYDTRIEPFFCHDDFQVSTSWFPAALTPPSVREAYPPNRKLHLKLIKRFAEKHWDFVFWPTRSYVKHFLVRELIEGGKFDQVRERLFTILETLSHIRMGRVRRIFLVDRGSSAPPISATPYIAKFGTYRGLPRKENFKGGEIHRITDTQKDRFQLLAENAADRLGYDVRDPEALPERLRQACTAALAFEQSLITFSALFDELDQIASERDLPPALHAFIQRGTAMLRALRALPQNPDAEAPYIDLFLQTDLEAILPVEQASFSAAWDDPARFLQFIDRIDAFVLRAPDHALVGYALIETRDGVLWLIKMAVTKNRRRQGLGTQIVQWVKELARQQNLEAVHLHVRASNTSGITLYEQAGFEIIAHKDGYYKKGSDPEENTALEMRWLVRATATEKPLPPTSAVVQRADHEPAAADDTSSASPAGTNREHVFISYSHKDNEWLEALHVHLTPYLRNRVVTTWDDSHLVAGDKWFEEIEMALKQSKVAILLVTPHFLASEFIHEHELSPLLQAAKDEGVRIMWIAVSASSYMETELKTYQAVNDPSAPLDTMKLPERNKAFVSICQKIKQAAVA